MSTKFDDFFFSRTATKMKLKGIEERHLVENHTTNVVVSFNFYQFLLLTPFEPYQIDVGE